MEDAYKITAEMTVLVSDDRPNTRGDAERLVLELLQSAVKSRWNWDWRFAIIPSDTGISVTCEPIEED